MKNHGSFLFVFQGKSVSSEEPFQLPCDFIKNMSYFVHPEAGIIF